MSETIEAPKQVIWDSEKVYIVLADGTLRRFETECDECGSEWSTRLRETSQHIGPGDLLACGLMTQEAYDAFEARIRQRDSEACAAAGAELKRLAEAQSRALYQVLKRKYEGVDK